MTQRPKERIGDLRLSVQASSAHDSFPQTDDLDLGEYSHVEVSIYQGRDRVRPSEVGLPKFDCYFDEDDTAHCMAKEVVNDLRKALESLNA
jgi:hypothetical protein